jgi:hypothetical protein
MLDPGYRYCPRVDLNVDLRGAEGDCRDQHGCADPNCPLSRYFGADPIGMRVNTLAGLIGGWPFSAAKSPKG